LKKWKFGGDLSFTVFIITIKANPDDKICFGRIILASEKVLFTFCLFGSMGAMHFVSIQEAST
jgi:hypothetical protein